jgi:DNA modification methylase
MKPYYEDEHVQIWHGDCREVIKTLADSSVDSVVCDPPYELGFMGKGWDRSGIAYDVAVWSECLRVLKPGGHLLAFGGSRTYHRLACAIEDAGFEIRDQIQYIYGSGFPKSLNVSKNLREEESVCICNEHNSDLHGLQNRIPDMESVAETDQDADLFLSVQRQTARGAMGSARLQRAEGENTPELFGRGLERLEESSMEGRDNLLSEARQLRADQVRALPTRVSSNGSQGRIRNGASLDHSPMDRAITHENGSGTSRRSQPTEQSAHEPFAMAGQSEPQTSGAWPLCRRCGKPMVPDGLGSALKPAHEPIVLARKPFSSTLIQNVLQHGTGGLNIDGCRIETDWESDATRRGWQGRNLAHEGGTVSFVDHNKQESQPNDLGRWPANIIHDGSDEVLSGFPQTDNSKASMRGTMGESPFSGIDGSGRNPDTNSLRGHDDNGGSAARFFYCAKSSQEDRNEGLEDLPLRSAGEVTDRKDGSAGLNSPRAGAGRNSGSRNPHPTVKPTDLMRYLCRLVTPPNGTVLDPFCGSGSTGKAAVLEGLRFIGVELSAEYCELAQRRIKVQYNRMTLYHLIDTKERQRLLIDA